MTAGSSRTSCRQDVAVIDFDVFYHTAIELKAKSDTVRVIPSDHCTVADGYITGAEVKFLWIAVGLDCDTVVSCTDEAVIDIKALAGHRIDAVKTPYTCVAEYLYIVICRVDAVCDGIRPAAGIPHIYAINHKVFAIVESGVACK